MQRRIKWLRTAILLLAAASKCIAQDVGLSDNAKRVIEVTLEARQDNTWRPVDARTVFQPNDEIRFRLRTSFGGYLYVLDRSSSGQDVWLFPQSKSVESNRITGGTSYLIPGGDGSFAIAGKPGYDATLWVLASQPLDANDVSRLRPKPEPNTLRSRCREETLKLRAPCLDENAGARPLTSAKGAKPDQLIARDLIFRRQDGPTQITAPESKRGIIVYEFRIAHD